MKTITLPKQIGTSACVRRGVKPSEAPAERCGTPAASGGIAPALGNMAIKERRGLVSVEQLRSRLWALQKTMWSVTDYKRLRGCHRWLAAGSGAASLTWGNYGSASWRGLQTSSSVWASPLSAASISKTRADQVESALKTWFELGKNHSVEFLTLTLAHNRKQSLTDTLAYAWRGITGTASWRGGARMVGDRERFGIEHWLKTVEVTHGQNGWHIHIHALFMLDRELTAEEREGLEARVYDRWSAAAQRRGFKSPSRAYGVHLETALRNKNARDLGSYMAKGALSSVAESLSWELAGGQTAKQAKSTENRTPFQILDSIRKSGDVGRKNPDVQLWREWEAGSLGRRQMAWSMGAKKALGVLDMDDVEAEELAEQSPNAVAVANVCFDEWNRKTDDGKLCDDLQKRNEIAAYVAQAKTAEQAYKLAAEVLTAYGIDFTQPEAPVPIEKPAIPPPPVRTREARTVLSTDWQLWLITRDLLSAFYLFSTSSRCCFNQAVSASSAISCALFLLVNRAFLTSSRNF